MKTDQTELFPLRFYALLSIVYNIFLLFITSVVSLLTKNMHGGILFQILLSIVLSPLVGLFGWLIDRGSMGANHRLALQVLLGFPMIQSLFLIIVFTLPDLVGGLMTFLFLIALHMVAVLVIVRFGPGIGYLIANKLGFGQYKDSQPD